MTVRQLVDALLESNALEIERGVKAVLAEKVADKLDLKREEISAKLFKNKKDKQGTC